MMKERTKVRWIKLNGREIQWNIERIQEARAKVSQGTPEYEMLTAELGKEFELLKKYRDSRFTIEPKVAVTLCVVGGIAVFTICLAQESPSLLKFQQFVLRLFRLAV